MIFGSIQIFQWARAHGFQRRIVFWLTFPKMFDPVEQEKDKRMRKVLEGARLYGCQSEHAEMWGCRYFGLEAARIIPAKGRLPPSK
jgi:hypothetical protein